MHTLTEALERTVRYNPKRTAVLDGAQAWTWAQFQARVAQAAGALRDLGLGPGGRYGLVAFNSPRFEEVKWAGFRIGAVPVPLNWRLAAPEMAYILADAGVATVMVDEAFTGLFAAPELARWRPGLVVLGRDGGTGVRYDDLFARARPAPAADVDPGGDAILLYTGGTTGKAKGVRLSHWNILSNALAFALSQQARPDDVYLHVAPMFHSADLLATGWFLLGAAHAYVPAFSPGPFLSAVARHRVTVTVMVPTMLMMTLGDHAFAQADVSSLRTLIFGASPMDPEWIRHVAAAFPAAGISNCYGLTETSPDLTVSDPREFRAAIEANAPSIAAVGKPNALVELRVMDASGAEAAAGEAGEIWVRGPGITKGYLNLPEETARAFAGGWLRTGDVGRIDEDGYVYLLDRLKDLIISGGENIYSAEVEAALYRHPEVLECAVIGVGDERLGETVLAVVVPRPGTAPTEAGLVAHCRTLIGGYKVPRRLALVDAMPKNAMGKILKTELRARFRS